MGLSHPIQSKMLHRTGDANYRVGAASMQGYRPEMEDSESMHLSLKNHPGVALFGVFDGHNGSAASQWLRLHLHEYLDALDDIFNPEKIQKALLQADADFLTTDNKHNGSTCVFVLVDHSTPKPWRIVVGNIGDSRALLCRDGKLVALTKDHKPTNDEELTRIRAAGGFVEFGRVDGQLALSRAIGDSPYKMNKALPLDKQRVIPVPDITVETVTENDFLVVCCDGIFEALSNEDTIRFVADKLQEVSDDPALVMSHLLDNVLKKGSRDNTTSILVEFKDGTDYNRGSEFFPGPIQAFRDDPWFVDAYTKNAQFYGFTLEQSLRRLDEIKKGLSQSSNHPNKIVLTETKSSTSTKVTDDGATVSETTSSTITVEVDAMEVESTDKSAEIPELL